MVEHIILSHGHYDHSGGLNDTLQLTDRVNLYLHPDALTTKFNRKRWEIGAPISSEKEIAPLVKCMIPTREPTEIIGNGSNAPGTLLDPCSETFHQHFVTAELIIAKGQANYESLSGQAAPIFFCCKPNTA